MHATRSYVSPHVYMHGRVRVRVRELVRMHVREWRSVLLDLS